MILYALFTWLPLIGFLPMAVVVLYLLVETLIEPATPYEGGHATHTSMWDDDDDWTNQAERGGW